MADARIRFGRRASGDGRRDPGSHLAGVPRQAGAARRRLAADATGPRSRSRMTTIAIPAVGALAPDFIATSDSGAPVSLAALRGRAVVLYFYPRDDTPSCTAEACGFRDAFPRFDAADATILGVSTDTVRSHARFREKFALPFTLLSDPDHAIAETYGVWQEKSM